MAAPHLRCVSGSMAGAFMLAAGCGVVGVGFISVPPASGRGPVPGPSRDVEQPSAAQRGTIEASASAGAVQVLASAACAGALAAAASRSTASARRQRRGPTTVLAEAPSVASAAIVEDEKAPPEAPFDPAKQVGATLPLMYWDPAGFCKVGDKDGFRNLRCAELKHGRVSMLAALGMVAQHAIKFPGFSDVPSGLGAVITPPGTFGLLVLVAASGYVETQLWTQDSNKEPGDFGDPLKIGQYYDEWRNRELNNGRMGMISILAIIVAELVSGKDGVDQIWQPLSNLPVE
mmetsp:Transcript_112041/g.316680  ORF Transcript_112041/g.316680 Transcript_112041/m.316680 type:complete len:289 (+) Transcript_112041:74-940(+)